MSNDGNVIEYMSTFSVTSKRLQAEAKQAAQRASKVSSKQKNGIKKLKSSVQGVNTKERE